MKKEVQENEVKKYMMAFNPDILDAAKTIEDVSPTATVSPS